MTLREFYENILIEQNKRKAPAMLLADFNYLFKKSTFGYLETRYIAYDKEQISVDDLGSLKVVDYQITLTKQGLHYKGQLPTNYLHILNCSTEFKALHDYSCYSANDTFIKATNRLPSGAVKNIEDNFYFKASYKKPYFYQNNNLLEIRSGENIHLYPNKAFIDYLKQPTTVNLTEEHIESVDDISPILEFSEKVCLDIINYFVKLLLENTSDQRLQTNIPVNQIIPPTR